MDMQNLRKLRERLRELYRRADPYADGRPSRQKDLADAIGLHPSELSNRLNQTKAARLTPRDVKAIVRTLAEWGAIQTQAEAQELLELAACPPFSRAEWQSPPLDLLTPPPPPRHASLPVPTSSFVGRGQLVQQCSAALTNSRLLTLTGPGGIGKTRLGLAVAAAVADKFANGVYFVELAALREPAAVATTLAASVEVSESRSEAITVTLVRTLRDKHILLILDNCEHLLTALVPLVESLLVGCPRLHILATSRELLSVSAELVWSVPPLDLPAANQSIAELGQNDAVTLFVERARVSLPEFQITVENAPAIAKICQLVEGIPLAIELASGWLRMLSVAQIADRLDAPLPLLGRVAHAVTRQQTLRACIKWSYELLSPPEQLLLDRLSVFHDGWELAAAEGVCADAAIPAADILILLRQLVNKSLVLAYPQNDVVRYRMLETIRQFALEQLTLRSEVSRWQHRHAEYYLAFVEAADSYLRGEEQVVWLRQLATERDNWRAALHFWLNAGEADAAMHMARALWRFWYVQGYYNEGRDFLEAALRLGEASSDLPLKARLLNNLSIIAWLQADYPAARGYADASYEIKLALGDRVGVASALNNMAIMATEEGDYVTARQQIEQSLAVRLELSDEPNIAGCLHNLADIELALGNYTLASDLYHQSLERKRALGDYGGQAITLSSLAIAQCKLGSYPQSQDFANQSLDIGRKLGSKSLIALALLIRGHLATIESDYCTAAQNYRESLSLEHELRHTIAVLTILDEIGRLVFDWDGPDSSYLTVVLLEATRMLRQRLKVKVSQSELSDTTTLLILVKQKLGVARHQLAMAEAEALDIDQAASYGLTALDAIPDTLSQPPSLPFCPHCQADATVTRAGLNLSGSQRYRCCRCRRYFTPHPTAAGYSEQLRAQALQLHRTGMSQRAIGRQLGLPYQNISNWLRQAQDSEAQANTD